MYNFIVESGERLAKVVTWNRSISSMSSSSRNPLGTAIEDRCSGRDCSFVEEFAMISGSHSSTLDRLYAWERKLYDEVKVSFFKYHIRLILFFIVLKQMQCK